jgi:hypothetical protein
MVTQTPVTGVIGVGCRADAVTDYPAVSLDSAVVFAGFFIQQQVIYGRQISGLWMLMHQGRKGRLKDQQHNAKNECTPVFEIVSMHYSAFHKNVPIKNVCSDFELKYRAGFKLF